MKTTLILGIIALLVVLFVSVRKDGFTSPGTMVQLASSHVPTEEDAYYMRHIYPQIIKRDLINMTGSY
jgi:hypothetical protein